MNPPVGIVVHIRVPEVASTVCSWVVPVGTGVQKIGIHLVGHRIFLEMVVAPRMRRGAGKTVKGAGVVLHRVVPAANFHHLHRIHTNLNRVG